jgi:uncharacterized membrane protein YgdD (TMEM256/DUF423 family)
MSRAWLAAGAIGGFLSVAAGVVAAHLAAGGRAGEVLRIGSLYGMVHAAALIATARMAEARAQPDLALIIAGWGLAVGMMLFSFSLFALALTGFEWFGLVTPFGGVGLLVGWAAFGVHAFRRRC